MKKHISQIVTFALVFILGISCFSIRSHALSIFNTRTVIKNILFASGMYFDSQDPDMTEEEFVNNVEQSLNELTPNLGSRLKDFAENYVATRNPSSGDSLTIPSDLQDDLLINTRDGELTIGSASSPNVDWQSGEDIAETFEQFGCNVDYNDRKRSFDGVYNSYVNCGRHVVIYSCTGSESPSSARTLFIRTNLAFVSYDSDTGYATFSRVNNEDNWSAGIKIEIGRSNINSGFNEWSDSISTDTFSRQSWNYDNLSGSSGSVGSGKFKGFSDTLDSKLNNKFKTVGKGINPDAAQNTDLTIHLQSDSKLDEVTEQILDGRRKYADVTQDFGYIPYDSDTNKVIGTNLDLNDAYVNLKFSVSPDELDSVFTTVYENVDNFTPYSPPAQFLSVAGWIASQMTTIFDLLPFNTIFHVLITLVFITFITGLIRISHSLFSSHNSDSNKKGGNK